MNGRALKEAGMQAVTKAEFLQAVIHAATRMRGEFTGEDIRIEVESYGIRAHHWNAWGAAIHQLRRLGIIVPTGKPAKMKRALAHCRENPVYRRA